MRRTLLGAALSAGLALVLLATGAPPALAHTDTGTFSATRAEPATDGTYTIDLLLTYDNDGHGAEGAALTVTVQGPSGAPVPVTMSPGDRAGAYTGEVPVDAAGDYTVTASSAEPEAQTSFTFTVAEAPTTTVEAPTTTSEAEPEGTTTTTSEEEDDTSENPASLVANGLLLALGAAGAFFAIRWWRKRRPDGSAP